MVNRRYFLKMAAALATAIFSFDSYAQDTLPAWTEGTLDLHFIATGRGDASLYVLPDGTRILCDAGDVGTNWHVDQPDPSMMPGEWVAKYIKDFSAELPGKEDVVDYFYLTHYHGDHIGTYASYKPGTHGYALSGITQVGEQIHFNKIIDRQCATLSWPSKEYFQKTEKFIRENYIPFCKYQQDSCGTILENFKIGAKDQFKLVHNPKQYKKSFEIYNIAANGFIHTGKGSKTRPMFKDSDPNTFDENMFSCVFLMKYGKFTYYNGGDVCGGDIPAFKTKNRDFESQIADLIGGHVTMMKPDHHGWKDAVNPYFLNVLSPDLVVVMCSQTQHPYYESFLRMIDPLSEGYPRKIFFTTDGSRERMGQELGIRLAEIELSGKQFTSAQKHALADEILDKNLAKRLSDQLWSHVNPEVGHIVVRVYPGGESYQIFVLDAKTPGYKLLYKSEIINL